MAAQGRDARALANASVAAIGSGTEAALAAGGMLADIVPERFVAEELVEELNELELEGKPVLIARAAEAREVLPDALRKRGAEVDVVALYETVAEAPDPEALERARDADFITFTSSSTVRNFMEASANGIPEGARVVSIGPITSEAAPRGRAHRRRRGRAPRHRRPRQALLDAAATTAGGLTPKVGEQRHWIRPWRRRGRSPSSPTTGTRTSSPASAGP